MQNIYDKKYFKKYLNKEYMLQEISKSKATFCWIKDDNKEYMNYDYVVDNLEQINDDIIMLAKQSKANKLTYINIQKVANEKNKSVKVISKKKELYQVDVNEVNDNELIFRVQNNDHVPMVVRTNGIKAKHKTNFPAFKHYMLNNGKYEEVVRSHWIGNLYTGKFSTKHGKLSDGLGKIILLLTQKYSMHWRFRNYTYRDEMVGDAITLLCMVALKFDETKLTKTNSPFSFYTQIITNSFKVTLNNEKKVRNIRDDLIEIHGQTPSSTRQANLDDIEQSAKFYNEIEHSYHDEPEMEEPNS